ncbi:MAG TPA: alpha/beta hydrolase [Candidatus Limnocylindrales bacterium]|nr:alpha/beta hydrolase [Candidatus Limnocylindrales bacterium]
MNTQSNKPRSWAMRVLLVVLCLKLLGWMLIWRRYQHDTRVHRRRIAAGRLEVQTPCGVIEYGEVGAGTPVLVIHGSGGGYDQGLLMGARLGEGFRVIAPSRFSYLNAPLPDDASVVAQADAYACLLDALKIDCVVVMGLSAGGPSVLQFALRYPERVSGLVLACAISNVRPVRDVHETAQAALLRDFPYWLLVNLAPGVALGFLGLSQESQRHMTAEEREYALRVLRDMMPLGMRATGIAYDSLEDNLFRGAEFDLARITAPALVVHATDDTFVPFRHAQYSAAHIPGARLLSMDRGGHFVAALNEASMQIGAFIIESTTRVSLGSS